MTRTLSLKARPSSATEASADEILRLAVLRILRVRDVRDGLLKRGYMLWHPMKVGSGCAVKL